jgi:ubiquinone/menaquinone biosynthesis C-methylase UbiE
MTKKSTSDYYDLHWSVFADSDYPKAKIEKVKRFFNPVNTILIKSRNLLDVGCGDGIHWYYLKEILKLPILYHGIDISQKSMEFLTKQSKNKVCNFQTMDACQLAYANNSFDVVFAYGVIGYTVDPCIALQEISRVCQPSGIVGIFSPEITGIFNYGLKALRAISSGLSNKGKFLLADLLVPFFGLVPSESDISLKNASWKQVREVILTDIAPPNLSFPSYRMITAWLKNNHFQIISDDSENPTSIWVKKNK